MFNFKFWHLFENFLTHFWYVYKYMFRQKMIVLPFNVHFYWKIFSFLISYLHSKWFIFTYNRLAMSLKWWQNLLANWQRNAFQRSLNRSYAMNNRVLWTKEKFIVQELQFIRKHLGLESCRKRITWFLWLVFYST